ncbi:MAG: hypothetical protein IJZ72_07290 [Oscillospiraceae bacterium]|nr:hypothetical protein [Oscillospiraceae bacterium]
MKNNIVAVIAASFLLLAGCAERAVDSSDGTSGTETSATGVIDEQQRRRLDEFYASIKLAPDEVLSRSTGGITGLANRDPEKNITYAESLTKGMVEKLREAESFRITYADSGVKMETAVKGQLMKIAVCTEQSASAMLFDGNLVHALSPMEMSGYRITLSDEDMKSYTPESLLESTVFYPDSDDENVSVSTVMSDGSAYICEVFDGFAYIYGQDGSLAMFCDNSNNFTAQVETEDISDEVFVLPEGYEIADHDVK